MCPDTDVWICGPNSLPIPVKTRIFRGNDHLKRALILNVRRRKKERKPSSHSIEKLSKKIFLRISKEGSAIRAFEMLTNSFGNEIRFQLRRRDFPVTDWVKKNLCTSV